MCGIAGILRLNGVTTPEHIAAVKHMLAVQIHRGPDDSGLYHNDQAVLGHRRLSIIDLSPAGHQPMSNEDGTVWITYNGEIYNYRELRDELVARGHIFISQADTEVVIHGYEEWGIKRLLQRLRGMFAFALYTSRSRSSGGLNDVIDSRFILARDRLGIKPLYYCIPKSGEFLAFASEVKALIKSGLMLNEKDLEAFIGFLLFGSVPAPLTTVKGIRCLPPGHYLIEDSRRVALYRYWDLEHPPHHECLRVGEDLIAELPGRLEDAVARHLVSDVPVGIFLSGGVDSAGLVALASRAKRSSLKTLTVVFEEHEFSEAEQARQIAGRFHTEHSEVLVRSNDFMQELPGILRAMDQPTNDGVNTYFVSRAARQSGLTVVLSGLGADEVFWGYQHYRWIAGQSRTLRVFSKLPSAMRKAILESASAYGRIRGRESWMRFAYLSRGISHGRLYLLVRGFFAPEQIAQLLSIERSELEAIVEKIAEMLQPPAADGTTITDSLNYIEMKRYLHDQLLQDTDAFSMAHSIEVRVPYLDHMIVELAANIPYELKLNRAVNKPLLIQAVGEPLLVEAGKRKKKGFVFPMTKWMKRHAEALEDIAVGADVLDRRAVRRLWKAFRAGRLHWSRAWALVVLGATSDPSSTDST